MTAMEDMSAIVLEQADRLFQLHVSKAVLAEADAGYWPASLWAALEDAGLPMALVPEAVGGVGLAAGMTAKLIRRAAFHSVPLPLAETMIANRLWVDAGGDPLEGAVTLAPVNATDRLTIKSKANGALLDGRAHHVPWSAQVSAAIVFARDAGGRGFLCRTQPASDGVNKARRNIAYEPRGEMHFDGVVLSARDVRPAPAYLQADGLMTLGAAIRVQQLIGGMERCMDYALSYANERVQFGRPIGKFQPCSTCWRSRPAISPRRRPRRMRCSNPSGSATMILPSQSPRRDAAKPPGRSPRCAIRFTARWALPRSTRCISRRAGCGRGATSGVRKCIGKKGSAAWSAPEAATAFGR
jgi:acyl-CoA dehydrogenase